MRPPHALLIKLLPLSRHRPQPPAMKLSLSMAKQHAAACLAACLSLPEATMGRSFVSVGVSGSPAMMALDTYHTPSPALAGSTEAGAEKREVLLYWGSRDGVGANTKTACFVPPTLARPATKLSRTVEPADQFIERTASLERILRTLADQARCLRCMQK